MRISEYTIIRTSRHPPKVTCECGQPMRMELQVVKPDEPPEPYLTCPECNRTRPVPADVEALDRGCPHLPGFE